MNRSGKESQRGQGEVDLGHAREEYGHGLRMGDEEICRSALSRIAEAKAQIAESNPLGSAERESLEGDIEALRNRLQTGAESPQD